MACSMLIRIRARPSHAVQIIYIRSQHCLPGMQETLTKSIHSGEEYMAVNAHY